MAALVAIGRGDRLGHGELAALPERQQRRERGMQAEAVVELDGAVASCPSFGRIAASAGSPSGGKAKSPSIAPRRMMTTRRLSPGRGGEHHRRHQRRGGKAAGSAEAAGEQGPAA